MIFIGTFVTYEGKSYPVARTGKGSLGLLDDQGDILRPSCYFEDYRRKGSRHKCDSPTDNMLMWVTETQVTVCDDQQQACADFRDRMIERVKQLYNPDIDFPGLQSHLGIEFT